jgi:transcriptional regulator with GAF, ATPase, and Fis domain
MVNTRELTEISAILQKGLSSDETHGAVMQLLERVVAFSAATLFIYREKSDQLEMVMQRGEFVVDLASNVTFSKGKGISSFIARQKRPVILPSLMYSAAGKNMKINSFLSIPLWIGERLIGLLNLAHEQPDIYTDSYSADYELIGQQVSLVLEKMHLRTQLEEQNRILQSTLDELKKTQAQLVDRERFAAIGEVVVTINHEINNPLATIVTNAEMLAMVIEMNNPEKVKTISERIVRGARQISEVTRQLRNLSEAKKKEYLPNVSMIELSKNDSRQDKP